ncbi:MAG: beta strand repeat-containing protein [Flavobacteriaceae bacterium]
MARISSYPSDGTLTADDKLLGIDSGTGNSATYTLGALSNFFNVDSVSDTNYYLDGITQSGNVLTFSVNGATNQTFTFGSAAFAATTDFAASNHTHVLGDVVGTNSITASQLNVDGNGDPGQYLISDGDGSFSWSTVTNPADTNYYLDGITKAGNILTFSVNGAANQSYTFGEAAFLSVAALTDQIKTAIDVSDLVNLGTLAELNSVGGANINNNAISTTKIVDSAITEPKINATNSPVSGYVLTSDGSDGFTWAFNSASNYYVNAITKSTNTLTFEIAGGLASSSWPTYTFGDAAFKSVGTSSGDVAAGDHNHDMSSITNAGNLATLNTVNTSEITNGAVTIDKLSPSAGSNGQFLTITGGNLAWATIATTATDFLTLPSTPSSFTGAAGQYLKINTGETAVEFAALAVGKTDITTTNSGSAGRILGIDSNGDLEWTTKSSAGAGSVQPTNLSGLANNGTSGQLIQTDGDGTFSYVNANTFDGAFSSLTGTPTTIAGYGITDAFDGAFSSLTGTPTTLSGYGITDGLTSVSYADLGNEFKTIASTVTLSSSSTTATCDFSASAVFPIILPSDATNTTITYSNSSIGQTKILKVTGSGGTGTVTISGVKVSGTLDQTNSTVNYIQISAIGPFISEYIYTISQA